MRRNLQPLTVTAASAALLAALGVAMAQQAPRPPGGPDSAQSNNERLNGIQDNTNNSYKTWPESLSGTAPHATARGTARATGSQSMAHGGATHASTGSGSTGGSSKMLPPRAARN